MYWFVIIPCFCYTEPVNKNNNKTVIAINTYCLNKSQQQQYSHLHVSHHQIQWPFLVQLHPSSTLLELAFPLERQIKNDLTFYAKSNFRWEYATKHQHSWRHYHKNTNCCCVQDQKHAQVVGFLISHDIQGCSISSSALLNCSYHILTFVICYWTDVIQQEICLLNNN